MKLKSILLQSAIATFILFTLFSYTVAKELWQKWDFDITVKVQDRMPKGFDEYFSSLSLLASAEITIGLCFILSFLYLIKRKIKASLGWLVIIHATVIEIFGKLVVFHPGPPLLFHKTDLPTALPSFYIHTNFSYPSGHMTRTAFLVTVLLLLLIFSKRKIFWKYSLSFILLGLTFMMALTRVYLGEHWLSDVLGGGLLGLSMGLFAALLIL